MANRTKEGNTETRHANTITFNPNCLSCHTPGNRKKGGRSHLSLNCHYTYLTLIAARKEKKKFRKTQDVIYIK